MENADKLRVIVLGDSGVGKTTFIQALVNPVGNNLDARKLQRTIGCFACPQFYSNSSGGSEYWIEWLEIGGGRSKNQESRKCFYTSTPVLGIVLVYDMTNKKSLDNLWKWLNEAMTFIPRSDFVDYPPDLTSVAVPSPSKTGTMFDANQQVPPLMLVGMKSDLVVGSAVFESLPRSSILDDYGGITVQIGCPKIGSSPLNDDALNGFNLFINRIIEASKHKSPYNSTGDLQSKRSDYLSQSKRRLNQFY